MHTRGQNLQHKAAELHFVGCHPSEYEALMDQDGDTTNIRFQTMPPVEIVTPPLRCIKSQMTQTNLYQKETCPTVSPRPDKTSKQLDFRSEIKRVPFKPNLGENALLTPLQQAHFIDTILTAKKFSHYMMKILVIATRLPI